ncbi:MAG: 50S ribosomal protein L11 methyltransferase [Methyloligellaceae bacterium]
MGYQPTYRVSLILDRDVAERAETYLSVLHLPSPTAIGLSDQDDGKWQVDAYFDSEPDMQALSARLGEYGAPVPDLKLWKLDDVDWVTRSQQGLHAVRAGRFLVHGSHDRNRVCTSRWAIEIDAGQAFGTAHHGSTLGCLHALDELAKRRTVSRVLDIGTGTGVLAIAAAKTWRAQIIASDLDPLAAEIAKENCKRNGIGANVRTVTAAGMRHQLIRARAPYDLVIANILAGPLMTMAHDMAPALRHGGIVILSGITREQAGRIAAAYGAAGFSRHRRITISGWVTLTLMLRRR